MAKIAHLTSVHIRHDTRILLKQCRSLAAAGHDVFLVVADGQGDEDWGGVQIVDAGKSRGRFARMLTATQRILKQALVLDADLYQLHDPELLFAGLALKRRGKRVIFDAHEDLPRQILAKPHLHPALRGAVSKTMAVVERFVCCRLDAVVAATPVIRDKFSAMGIAAIDINNFPILGELEAEIPWEKKESEVLYVGAIEAIRGIREIVAAMSLTESAARLNLAGFFSDEKIKAEVKKNWDGAKSTSLGLFLVPN